LAVRTVNLDELGRRLDKAVRDLSRRRSTGLR
jgi:hypothetical protein